MKQLNHCPAPLACASIMLLLAASPCSAALLGTQLGVQLGYQVTSVNYMQLCTTLNTATVAEPGVEFPSLASLGNSCSPLYTVNVDINAGDDFLEIAFANANSATFAHAFFNGYIFTFTSDAAIAFQSATINASVTTLGLTPSRVNFSGNQLFVNVADLPFTPTSFARIDLTTVPLPPTAWLLATGLLGALRWGKKVTSARALR